MGTTADSASDVEGDKESMETSHRLDDLDGSRHENVTETVPDATESHPQREYLSGVKLWLMLASVTLISFVMLLDMSIIATAIPRITDEFNSLGDIAWYGSAFLLANCALQPLAGRLYTLLSPKYTFLSFLVVFEIGSTVCGAAPSSPALIVGRAVAGLGASGLMNGAFTIITMCSPIDKQPLMTGIMMSMSQVGIICGPVIGGALTDSIGWRWCFYINIPIGAAAALFLVATRIPDHGRHEASRKQGFKSIFSKLDLIGFVFFSAFTIMVLLALEWGGSAYPWDSSVIIGLFVGGLLSLVIFVAWERRVGDFAMIPGTVVRRLEVWSSSLYLGFFTSAMMVCSFYLPIYFQAVMGVTALRSGVYMLAGILPQILMAITSGALIGRMGYYLPWALASAIIACSGAAAITTLTVGSSVAQWVMYQFIAGFGRGCGGQTPVVAIQNLLPPAQISLGLSVAIFTQTFGGSVALTIAQLVFKNRLVDSIEKYVPAVDPGDVVNVGASAFRQSIPSTQLTGVIRAYAEAFDDTIFVAVAASAATFVCAWGMGWRNIKQKKT